MELGDNLSLSGLTENKDDNTFDGIMSAESSLQQDLIFDDDEDIIMPQQSQQKDNNTSEPEKEAESVAGEEGKEGSQEPNVPKPGTKGSESSPSDDKTSQLYSSIAAHFQEAGILPSLNLKDKPIKSAEDLQSAITEEIKSARSERQKAWEEAMEDGIPQDVHIAYQKEMEALDGITEETIMNEDNAQLRVNIIGQDFINKGYDKEKALKYAQRSVELGEDIEDAKSALDEIKTFKKDGYQSQIDKIKDQESQVNNDIKKFIDDNEELVSGLKLNPNTKEKLFKQITTPITRTKDGKVLSEYGKALTEEPTKMKVMTEYLFMVTKGFTDFSKFNASAETKATKTLDEILKNNGSALLENGGFNFNNQDSNSKFTLGDFQIDA